MKILARYFHGSEDSVDIDVIYIVDALPGFQECREFCSDNKEENRNLAVVENGAIKECFIGLPDELNNSLIATYGLHKQEYPLTLRPVERDVFLKFIRATRIILSHLTRTEYRASVKSALKSHDLSKRVEILRQIDVSGVQTFGIKNMSDTEVLKKIAFQCGQYILLVEGIEAYTKSQICECMPDLTPYIYRRSQADCGNLRKRIKEMINKSPLFEQLGQQRIALCKEKRYDIRTERILTNLLGAPRRTSRS